MSETPVAFVLMPFDEEFTPVYTDLIKKTLEDVGYAVRRADSLFNQQSILKDIVQGIADATLVVADVTGLNENVLYELGLAHALGKRTVMITQALEELPFDLRPYRANEYSTQFSTAHLLAEKLKDIGVAVLAGEADFSNPVQDFAPHALQASAQVSEPAISTLSQRGRQPQAAKEHPATNDDSNEEDDPPGLLELLVDMQEGGEKATEAIERIGSQTLAIGEKIDQHTEQLQRVDQSVPDRAPTLRLAIARRAAQDIDAYAAAVEEWTPILKQGFTSLAVGANALAKEGQINTSSDLDAMRAMIETLEGTEQGISDGLAGVVRFATTLIGMPNVERSLSRATKRAASVLNQLAEDIDGGLAEFARARSLLQERLKSESGRLASEDSGLDNGSSS